MEGGRCSGLIFSGYIGFSNHNPFLINFSAYLTGEPRKFDPNFRGPVQKRYSTSPHHMFDACKCILSATKNLLKQEIELN